MKQLILLLILTIAVPVFGQEWKVKVGEQTPVFEWKDKKEERKDISMLKGKVVLINFFATWCPPCRQELPRVENEIWAKYKSRTDFSLLVFAREEGWDKLNPFMSKQQYTFPVFPDLKREIFSKYADTGIPRNVILNKKGEVVYQSIGYTEDEFKHLLTVLESELAK
ncbi:TlpA family protein disulfide reductase [Sphingobacterium spiritivorum]|uniref:Redoxin family protein n=1 Tax=Sphingobacterium spiritivorum ATCC 33861 TaxID=525373 RepID=D7VHS9_SPHSI|nr:TlpA disulfide reductase family protein [Sphingobacterium spiritivorum]EFK59631.1 redoxin family protein [Sphingobacterium spiritivorum ATCC 33861]QQT37711.1 TlpA family protein disulfide reductase [Sphingobacterium spiritivorum]WQD34514.1 TlpA disulfide reductase family protein [Sphingobacterium spiritivorum]SUI97497.1 Thiol-disulfide oxidoreductase resA [Sphingobacterium spiritivorum]